MLIPNILISGILFDPLKENELSMKQLNLDSFILQESDPEISHYKILSGLSVYRNELSKNRLYPSLQELVHLSSQLQDILYKRDNFSILLSKQKSSVNFKEENLILSIPGQTVGYNDCVYDLIEWSLPLIKSLIEEAYVIYDFVAENISIIEVGVSPAFKDEGFLMLPDIKNEILQVHRYKSIIYSTQSSPYHSLKTSFLENHKLSDLSNSLELLKHNLLIKYDERPNLATFVCRVDIDVPFDETIFLIAKRKLLNLLIK